MKLTGNILTNNRWVFGDLIIPGFIDLHVHGGRGMDIMQGGEATRVIAQMYARYGTTSLLATIMTAKEEKIIHALKAIAQMMKTPTGGADIMGVHLEGPFINAAKLGAQPNYTTRASRALIHRFHAIAPIRIVTLAPEFSKNLDIIPWLVQQNIHAQIGHTLADYGQCICALKAGAQSFTHLYNAMSPLRHRAPGAVGSALAKGFYCEIIPDLIHADKGAVLTAMRAIPRLYGITDGTAACGMPDGKYKLGENNIYKKEGIVRLKNGTLAGSVLTLDQAFKNFIMLGDSPIQASKRLSEYQADYLRLEDRGRLLPGLRADINVMDKNFNLLKTYVAGHCVHE